VRIWDVLNTRCVTAIRTGHALRHVAIDGMNIAIAGERGPYFLAKVTPEGYRFFESNPVGGLDADTPCGFPEVGHDR
jgi:hypothetical protein